MADRKKTKFHIFGINSTIYQTQRANISVLCLYHRWNYLGYTPLQGVQTIHCSRPCTLGHKRAKLFITFYPRDALHSAVFAVVRCPSVTHRDCIETEKDIIRLFPCLVALPL